ncbi:Hypothetical predicted protein [Octopus vulgaris]|uniref:Uncharacterized protein n=1 Tax=Octopus vulgaris TaxID=6645 RepID=A0AA36BIQ0_OCTVU|nr:Hypothetical predicted protein [Octopus vulgaris]
MNLSRVGFNDDSVLDERQLYEGQLLPLASSTPQKSRKRTESLSQLHPHLTYDEAKRPEFEDDRQRNLQQGDARISSLSRSGVTPPGATASDRVSSVKRDENISDERTLWPFHAIDTPTKYRERLARLSSRPQRVTHGAAKWPEVADTTALSQIEFPQEKEIDELIETHPDRISKQKPLTPVGPIPWENILRKQDSSYKFPSVDLSWSQMLLSDDEIPSGRRRRRRSYEPSIVHDSLTPRRLSDISYVYQEPHLDLINVSPAIDELFRDVTPSRPGEPPPGDTASLSPVKYDENESVIEEEIDRLDEMRSVIEKEIDILDEKRSVTEEEIDRLDEMRSAAEEEIDRLDEIRNATEEEIDKLDEIRSAIGKETHRLDEMRGATEEEIERADEKRSVTEEVIDGLDEMRSVTEEIDGLDEKRSVTEEEIDRLDEIRNAIGTEIERLDEIRGFTEEELERLDGMRSVTEEEIDRLDEMRSVIETQTEKTDDRISPQRHHKYLSETLPALQRSPLRITPDYPLSRTLPIVKISEFSDPYRAATRACIPPKSQMSPRYRQPQEILLRTSTDANVSPVSSEEPSLLSDDLIDQSLSPFSKISDISLILSEPSVNVPYEDSESIVPGVFPENIPNILEAYEEKDSESVLRDIFALPPISDGFQEEDAKDEGSSHYESWEEFPEEEYITSIPEESKQNTERSFLKKKIPVEFT